MTSFAGSIAVDLSVAPIPGSSRKAYTWCDQESGYDVLVDTPSRGIYATYAPSAPPPTPSSIAWKGVVGDRATPAYDWFERFHVIPRAFHFGNILSTQLADIEVYNAARLLDHNWLTYVDNAGAGVTLLGQPSLPTLVRHQTGVQMTLQVSTNGPPRVDTTLDFGFDIGNTIRVPITLQRVVLFDVQPEVGYIEKLEFLTNILSHMSGTEQRVSIRKCPRQVFEWDVILLDGNERDRIEAILFDWQSQVFGVPVWHEMRLLQSGLSSGAFTVPLDTTAYADYRLGGLFLIYQDQSTFDVLSLASLTGTSLTATTPTLNSYAPGAMIMPLRTALATSNISGTRWRMNGARLQIRFQVNDNDASLASTAGWSTFNSKVLVDVGNVVVGELSESYERELVVLDSGSGLVSQQAISDRGRRVSPLTLRSGSPATLWKNRQLAHALRGRQVSFYLPTSYKDLEVTVDLASGANTMVVRYVGYANFIRNRQPKNVVRLVLADGSTYIATITGSTYAGGPTETLTVTPNWPSNISAASIVRAEYVEKVRLDSDTVVFQHTPGEVAVRMSAPVRTVLE